jgi:hypothetical protein
VKYPEFIEGPYGTAHNVHEYSLRAAAEKGFRTEYSASIATWFIRAPAWHPFWSCYMLGLVHLRDMSGVKPANKDYPEAEFEVMVWALNPELNPSPADRSTWGMLDPINVRVQFHGIGDDDARTLAAALVRGVVHGSLNPEPSGISGAREYWTKAVRDTADHFRGHPGEVVH